MSGLEPMSSAISSSSSSIEAVSSGRRTRDPAYDNPNVRATIRGLRDKLREASKQTGDIDKDILQLVIQPLMSKETVFAPLRNGAVGKGGRTYPSSQYGWLQQFFSQNTLYDMLLMAMLLKCSQKTDTRSMSQHVIRVMH